MSALQKFLLLHVVLAGAMEVLNRCVYGSSFSFPFFYLCFLSSNVSITKVFFVTATGISWCYAGVESLFTARRFLLSISLLLFAVIYCQYYRSSFVTAVNFMQVLNHCSSITGLHSMCSIVFVVTFAMVLSSAEVFSRPYLRNG